MPERKILPRAGLALAAAAGALTFAGRAAAADFPPERQFQVAEPGPGILAFIAAPTSRAFSAIKTLRSLTIDWRF